MAKCWSREEKELLFEHYPFISARRMTEILPNRTEMAIYKAAYQLGVRKVPERIVEQGRENVQKRKDRQCAPFTEPPSISS